MPRSTQTIEPGKSDCGARQLEHIPEELIIHFVMILYFL